MDLGTFKLASPDWCSPKTRKRIGEHNATVDAVAASWGEAQTSRAAFLDAAPQTLCADGFGKAAGAVRAQAGEVIERARRLLPAKIEVAAQMVADWTEQVKRLTDAADTRAAAIRKVLADGGLRPELAALHQDSELMGYHAKRRALEDVSQNPVAYPLVCAQDTTGAAALTTMARAFAALAVPVLPDLH